jgi:hypothetical protein
VGLALDLEAKQIITDGDLDCLCVSLARQKLPIFIHLPFSLKDDDLLAVLVKGAALWSLCLNARDHELVRAICQQECNSLGGSARLRLAESAGAERPFSFWGEVS